VDVAGWVVGSSGGGGGSGCCGVGWEDIGGASSVLHWN
jgi:hypothetical protein